MAVADRLDRGFGNVVRGRKIWLADAEVDDVLAFGGKRARTGKHSKGVMIVAQAEVAATWEVITDAGEELPGVLPPDTAAIEYVRTWTPILDGEQGPVAGLDIAAEYAADLSWNTVTHADGSIAPVLQMVAPAEEVDHVFFVEYGRKHSRTR